MLHSSRLADIPQSAVDDTELREIVYITTKVGTNLPLHTVSCCGLLSFQHGWLPQFIQIAYSLGNLRVCSQIHSLTFPLLHRHCLTNVYNHPFSTFPK